jgi:hypothetical protein
MKDMAMDGRFLASFACGDDESAVRVAGLLVFMPVDLVLWHQ